MMREPVLEGLGAVPNHTDDDMDRVKKDIAYFEARLNELGQSGDCAYEKAMVKVYDSMLEDRRRQLALLSGV
jgi:hypothetical protein